nr:rod shape-determining protein MreC [Flavihumibacter sp.]
MRNIFLFVRRYFNFLFFLALQVLALYFLFRYNRFHEAAFMGVASEVTGRINERYNNVDHYFKLRKSNEILARENLYLRERLRENYQPADTSVQLVVDSIRVDSLLKFQKYHYMEAMVVGGFVTTQTNFYTIHRGSNQGVRVDMAVIGPTGIVGRVVNVSNNFATVMSVLSRQFRVDAKLIKSGERGIVGWDGESTQYVQMRNVPKSTEVKRGDTVMTSELSSIFPANIMVGTVDTFQTDPSSNFYT